MASGPIVTLDDATVVFLEPVPASIDATRVAGAVDGELVVGTFDGMYDRLPEADCLLVPYPSETPLDRVRSTAPDLPLIALVEGNDGERAIEEGATDCFRPGEGETVLANRVGNAIERRRAEERADELVRERDRLARDLGAVMANAPISIYFKDEKARHVRVSDHQMANLRGQARPDGTVIEDREDVLGRTDPEIYTEETAQDSYEDDLQVIETGEPIRTKEERWNRSTVEWYGTTKVPWRNEEGEVIGLVGFTIDIVDRKRSQRLEEFVDVISHDLRNPLNVAQGQLDLLREEPDAVDLDAIAGSLDRMETFIDDLLGLAREGRTVGKLEATATGTVVREAWRSFESPEATLRVEWRERILADRTRLRELFENLFRNAIEHAGPDVAVEVGPIEGGFYVADDGPGIPEAEREDVFEWGHTASDGTGFGLAIVREIANGHGWDVQVRESDEGGARFEFRGVEAV